jgi:alpha-glucosidase
VRTACRFSCLLFAGLAATLVFASTPCAAQSGGPAVASPDGRLRMEFSVSADGHSGSDSGHLVYSVFFNGAPLLEDSGLSLDLGGGLPLGAGVRIDRATPGSGVDDYDEVWGKTGHVHDPWNSVAVDVSEPGPRGRRMTIEARAYNDALAFRYVVPDQPGLYDYRLEEEHTEFAFDKDASTWALELPHFRSAFEGEYVHPLHISALGDQGGSSAHLLIGLPLVARIPGQAWVAVTEANLRGNSTMYLTGGSGGWGSAGRGRYRLQTTVAKEFNGLPDVPPVAVSASLPHSTTWRILQIADRPGALIESNIIDDLNPPSAIADTSWIHPGKTAWDWWNGNTGSDGKSEKTTAMEEFYVDFAAQSKFRYMLIDAGWSKDGDITQLNGDVDVPAIVAYARSKGVQVWIWIDYAETNLQMEKAFPLYEKWGVAGVKIDFIQRGDQQGIEFYYRAARVAAEHHLMVDFHGTTTPWGLSRTWPNVLGFEGVMGMEYNKVMSRDDPIHRTTLPFTRMLNGPMDYTPGGFNNVTEAQFVARDNRPMVMGTRCQQLALYVIDFAPFQMVSDAPQAYAGQPSFQFILDVPAAWDETRVLAGTPSEDVTIARRSGKDWYVGSITNWSPRDVSLPLRFLGDGKYAAEIYRDAPDADRNPQHVTIEKKTVQRSDTLAIDLAPGGGAAIRLTPLP